MTNPIRITVLATLLLALLAFISLPTHKVDAAKAFSTTGRYLTVQTATPINDLRILTVVAWVVWDGGPTGSDFGRIVDKNKWSFTTQHGACSVAAPCYSFGGTVVYTTTTASCFGTSTVLTAKVPQFVAMTYKVNDGGCRLWKGTATSSVSEVSYGPARVQEAGVPTVDTTLNLNIGNREAKDRTFQGSIENLAIYNRVLTQTELNAIRTGGPRAITSDLVLFMPMRGITSQEYDSSSSRLIGTTTTTFGRGAGSGFKFPN